MYYMCEVTRALPVEQEVMLYAVLDVVAKCVRLAPLNGHINEVDAEAHLRYVLYSNLSGG